VLGRPIVDADYEGVHTTAALAVAAAYAIMTTDQDSHEGAYPVVLVLDVSGLNALPDIDALALAAELLHDNGIRGQYEGEDVQSAQDMQEYEQSEIGEPVLNAVFKQAQDMNIPGAFGDDDDAFQHWVVTGEYPPRVAIALVSQKRYLSDIHADRLVEVLAVKPWSGYVLGFYDDEDVAEEIESIEAQGYAVVTIEDTEIGVTTQRVAKGPAPSSNVEYHGTSSWHAMQAFSEIKLPANPFPIREDNPRSSSIMIIAQRLARGES